MKSEIYEYRDYKTYLVGLIDQSPDGSRGKRKALAEAMGCQVSHVTNVLSGPGHLSQEQTERAARFFGLNAQELEYLLLLLQFNRAGTAPLKKFYEQILDEKQNRMSALKSRLKMPDALRVQQEAQYYSSWQYGALHVLISIPGYQTREALAEKLGLPLARIDDILAFMVESGTVGKEGQEYFVRRPLLHLDKSSPLISKHHMNWRLKALSSLDREEKEDLHYSAVFSLAKKDLGKVRETLTRALSECFATITRSPEEEAAVLCLDFFGI